MDHIVEEDKMKTVMDKEFQVYGRVLPLDTTAFTAAINAHKTIASGQVVYEPSVREFEQLPLYQQLAERSMASCQSNLVIAAAGMSHLMR